MASFASGALPALSGHQYRRKGCEADEGDKLESAVRALADTLPVKITVEPG